MLLTTRFFIEKIMVFDLIKRQKSTSENVLNASVQVKYFTLKQVNFFLGLWLKKPVSISNFSVGDKLTLYTPKFLQSRILIVVNPTLNKPFFLGTVGFQSIMPLWLHRETAFCMACSLHLAFCFNGHSGRSEGCF